MNRVLVAVAVAVAVGLVSSTPARAQEVRADVETWRGVLVRLSQPSLDVQYTILPRPAPGASPAAAAAPTSMVGGASALGGAGGAAASAARPEPIQAREPLNTLTFIRDGIETRIPFDRIAGITVERRDVVGSTLPPYVRATHAQYSARAVLTDGSTIDATSVNFGMIILRGTSPQGTIELPLDDVKTLKITR